MLGDGTHRAPRRAGTIPRSLPHCRGPGIGRRCFAAPASSPNIERPRTPSYRVMKDSSIYTRDGAAAWRRVGKEMVLLQPRGERMFGLNGTGARVWEFLDGKRSVREIAENMAGECGQDVTRVLPD